MKGYFWDEKTNGWNSEEIGYFEESGAGPRHFVFNLKGDIMYLLNELESTVSVLEVKENYRLCQRIIRGRMTVRRLDYRRMESFCILQIEDMILSLSLRSVLLMGL